MSYNQITIVGNLTRDTEVITTGGGTEIMKGSVAVNDPFRKEHVDFIDIIAFGAVGTNTNKYTSKGSKILVSGKLQQNRWEDKDGNKRSKHEVLAQQIVFLDDKPKEGQSVEKKEHWGNNDVKEGTPVDIDDSSLPF